MMRRLFGFAGLGILFMWSCGQGSKNAETENAVKQGADGSLQLRIEQAACYSDEVDPSGNTAEWCFVVSKPGRFKVWLSSATKDTTDLSYENLVKVSLLDSHIEADPACDKIVRNSGDVNYPYFRADSYLGSVYISEPGQYNIQLISEKVASESDHSSVDRHLSDTRVMSVILDPVIR